MPPAGSPYASPHSAQRISLPKFNDVDNDKHSTMSQAPGVPRVERALDALQTVAGNRVRHARCAPEFLEEIATKGVQDSLKKSPHRKFKIVHGAEARTYFKNYIRDYGPESEHSRKHNDKLTNEPMPSPIVFAVTVWEGSIKCVDYYMTWRGKMKSHQGTEFERRATILDSEFRRLAKGLDKEYKSISSLRNYGNLSKGNQKFDKKSSHSSSFRHPPGIMVSTPEEESPVLDATQPPLPEPPVSATDSVMSLPLLNMVRGVPFSHRVPLRVANPDRLSVISDTSLLPAEVQDALDAYNANSNFSNNTIIPAVVRSTKDDRASDKSIKDSSASIRSSDTKSSKSSRSSRSTSSSENYDYNHPAGNDTEHHTRSSSRKIPEFLIILLGDKFETDTTSWHGLERQTSVKSLPAERHSPWIVPVVRSESSHRFSSVHTANDSDSDESDNEVGWKSTPVIPVKPLMEAMGILPNSTYYHNAPVVPGGLHYHLSVASSTASSQSHSQYMYSSPRQEPSSYLPTWHAPSQAPSNPPSRPASRAYSSAPYASLYASPYASPYMQSHTGPF